MAERQFAHESELTGIHGVTVETVKSLFLLCGRVFVKAPPEFSVSGFSPFLVRSRKSAFQRRFSPFSLENKDSWIFLISGVSSARFAVAPN